MEAINLSQPGFTVELRHRYPLPREAARWIARCPRCDHEAAYQRRRKGLACRRCCERLHGGRWDASCLLVFEPRTAA